jgi:hypothetical protein
MTNVGASVFLIALGAILAWAVSIEAQGININMIGVILMIVGLVYLVLSLLFWSSFAPFGGGTTRRTRVVEDRDVDVY